jgi:hypothetical protein
MQFFSSDETKMQFLCLFSVEVSVLYLYKQYVRPLNYNAWSFGFRRFVHNIKQKYLIVN